MTLQKKLALMVFLGILWASSVVYAFYRGSNMGYYYSTFSGYLPYDPSYEQLRNYVQQGNEYVEACNADIERIVEARNNAINDVNGAVERWNMSH